MSANVLGTVNVLEASRNAEALKSRLCSILSCYGLADTPTGEDHLIDPKYPYALSKYQGEQAVFHWHDVYKLPVNSIRIFNAYGTRSRTSGAYGAVFGVFWRQKLANKPYTVVGDGTQSRDLFMQQMLQRHFIWLAPPTWSDRFTTWAGNPQSVNRLVEPVEK